MTVVATSRGFAAQWQQECVKGSAIAPGLYDRAIAIVRDLEIDAIGEPSTPIHDALGWRYTRFGHQARANLQGALLLQETGDVWQVKLSRPRADSRKPGQTIKYETPKGAGSRAYLPQIDPATRHRLGAPPDGSFWDWAGDCPGLPIVLTEGGKKGLCGLSHGHIAIALTGVNGGYRKTETVRELIDDLKPFAVDGRPFVLAFDQDAKRSTRRKVFAAQMRLAALLSARGCDVLIAQWDGRDGKGLDDLVANRGPVALDRAIANAIDYRDLGHRLRLQQSLDRHAPAQTIDVPDLATAIEGDRLPAQGIIAIRSAKGTGKTNLLARAVAHEPRVLSLGHRVSLQRGLANRLGLHFINDLDCGAGQWFDPASDLPVPNRFAACIDSVLKIDPAIIAGGTIVLDEVDQLLRHLLTSSTCRKGDKRPAIIERLGIIIRSAGRVILASADLTDREIDYISALRGDGAAPYVLHNTHQRNTYPVQWIESGDDAAAIAQLVDRVRAGDRIWVSSDSRGALEKIAELLRPHARGPILEINSRTSGSDDARAFMADPDGYLASAQTQIVLVTPSVPTGLSVERYPFDAVFGLFYGVSLTDGCCSQSLSRVRPPVERIVWAVERGRAYSHRSRSSKPFEVAGHLQQRLTLTSHFLGDAIEQRDQDAIASINYHSPTMTLWSQNEASRNRVMGDFRRVLRCRLEFEGNAIERIVSDGDRDIRMALRAAGQRLKERRASAIVAAPEIDSRTAAEWERRDGLSPDQQDSLERYSIIDWYAIDPGAINLDDVLFDRKGRTRSELGRLKRMLVPQLAIKRDAKSIQRCFQWEHEATPWDIQTSELERQVMEKLGFDSFALWAASGGEWHLNHPRVTDIANRARACRQQLADFGILNISGKMTDTQIVGQLLSRYGLKNTRSRRRVQGGQRVYFYRLDTDNLAKVRKIFAQQEKRYGLPSVPPPTQYKTFMEGVGQSPQNSQTLAPASSDSDSFPPDRGSPSPGDRAIA